MGVRLTDARLAFLEAVAGEGGECHRDVRGWFIVGNRRHRQTRGLVLVWAGYLEACGGYRYRLSDAGRAVVATKE